VAKKKTQIQSSEIVKTASGHQYHINLAPGEVAPYIIVCGDPARAEKVAKLFDKVTHEASHREYKTFTGVYKKIPVSVMATGIGCGNTEIAVIELLQCVKNPVIIRVGSCGSPQSYINLGDLVISSGAVRLENVSTYFVKEGYPALTSPDVQLALMQASQILGNTFHVGLTATSPGFYGGQGRKVPGFPIRNPDMTSQLAAMKVANIEMEASVIFTLASLGGARAGAVCAVYASRDKNAFVSPELKENAEMNCILTGLTAIRLLSRLDKERSKRKDPHWFPWGNLTKNLDGPKKSKSKNKK